MYFLFVFFHWPVPLDTNRWVFKIEGQVAEQMISSFQRIKVQLSLMAQDNFVWYYRFYLWKKGTVKEAWLFLKQFL